MRYAYQTKKDYEARKNYIPKGENLEYYQSLPEKVPRCYTHHLTKSKAPKEKSQNILYFDVNIGNGKTGKLGLRKGDNPITKAKEFAKIFSLDYEMQDALAEMLIGYQSQMEVNSASDHQQSGNNSISEYASGWLIHFV